MLGAITVTDLRQGPAPALLPLVVGLLAAFTIYGRRAADARRAAQW
jgi:hypothetical protein